MYIAIAGNIGSGKTTLAEQLATHYGTKVYFEEPDNPYIDDFYDDMSRWSFNLQAYFLASRIDQMRRMFVETEGLNNHVIQDRTIYEDAYIFAQNLANMGLMSSRDLRTYMKMFDLYSRFVAQPDLLIYLRASIPQLKRHILSRGRAYESNIDESYLRSLEDRYEEWIAGYQGRMLDVDVDVIDFEHDTDGFARICAEIDRLNAAQSGGEQIDELRIKL